MKIELLPPCRFVFIVGLLKELQVNVLSICMLLFDHQRRNKFYCHSMHFQLLSQESHGTTILRSQLLQVLWQSNDHFKARTFLIDDRFWIEYIIGNTAYDLKHQLRKLASNVEMFFWKFCKAVLLTAVTKTLSCRVIKFQITDYTINLKKIH